MKYLILTCFLASLCFSCESEVSAPSGGGPLYSNSFEDGSDTGHFEATYDTDAPAGGGNYSLLVNGGCIAPHYELTVGPFSDEVDVTLAAWGKTTEGMSGSLGLYLPSNSQQQLSLEINTTTWQAYESAESMIIPAGETAILQFLSGGIIAVATHYDLVEVRLAE